MHRPQLVGPWNETLGLVTPGKWIDFFRFVSEPYDGILADQFDVRSTAAALMSKFQIIQDDYDVVFHPTHHACEVGEWTDDDTTLPDPEGPEPWKPRPYFLRANTGPRFLLGGVLSRPFITTKQSSGKFAITSIESSSAYGPGASVLACPFTLSGVHQVYTVFDGCINVTTTFNGQAHQVRVGESVFVPRGTRISIDFVDRYCRFWAFASGNGLETLISDAGQAFEGIVLPDTPNAFDLGAVQQKAKEIGIDI